MASITCFPSVVETAPPTLGVGQRPLAESMLIHESGQRLLVGEIALREGRAAQRIVNAKPDTRDYRALVRAGILLGAEQTTEPLTIALGFPSSTLGGYAPEANRMVHAIDAIEFDTTPIGGNGVQTYRPTIEQVHVTSEISACDEALRHGPEGARDAHFVLSVGYGTAEGAVFLPSGIVQRSVFSVPGLRYAVEQAMLELSRTYNLELRTEHQFDMHFRAGKIAIGRERVSLVAVRARALRIYFETILLPAIANSWSDEDYGLAEQLYLTGGGALYQPLQQMILEEFNSSLQVTVAPEPLVLASLGYALKAQRLAKPGSIAIGIDVGNANTCVCKLDA